MTPTRLVLLVVGTADVGTVAEAVGVAAEKVEEKEEAKEGVPRSLKWPAAA